MEWSQNTQYYTFDELCSTALTLDLVEEVGV